MMITKETENEIIVNIFTQQDDRWKITSSAPAPDFTLEELIPVRKRLSGKVASPGGIPLRL